MDRSDPDSLTENLNAVMLLCNTDLPYPAMNFDAWPAVRQHYLQDFAVEPRPQARYRSCQAMSSFIDTL